jgi:2-polyprenyl-6-methoxyphenol hydroxylase-like FAD-dependent oxidoreductase
VSEFDVAIIGGGPAGSAAALTLLRYSKLRPVILERSSYDVWRVGETLSPGVFPLLNYLGACSPIAVNVAHTRAVHRGEARTSYRAIFFSPAAVMRGTSIAHSSMHRWRNSSRSAAARS